MKSRAKFPNYQALIIFKIPQDSAAEEKQSEVAIFGLRREELLGEEGVSAQPVENGHRPPGHVDRQLLPGMTEQMESSRLHINFYIA